MFTVSRVYPYSSNCIWVHRFWVLAVSTGHWIGWNREKFYLYPCLSLNSIEFSGTCYMGDGTFSKVHTLSGFSLRNIFLFPFNLWMWSQYCDTCCSLSRWKGARILSHFLIVIDGPGWSGPCWGWLRNRGGGQGNGGSDKIWICSVSCFTHYKSYTRDYGMIISTLDLLEEWQFPGCRQFSCWKSPDTLHTLRNS